MHQCTDAHDAAKHMRAALIPHLHDAPTAQSDEFCTCGRVSVTHRGDPLETLPQLVVDTSAGLLVTDYSPLRLGRQWREAVAAALAPGHVAMHEVDAHNVVPVWVASDKREYAARTIRPKITRQLPEFLTEFPNRGAPPPAPVAWPPASRQPQPIDWDALIEEVTAAGAAVPEVAWIVPGEDAARAALTGPAGFLAPARIKVYDTARNDPSRPGGLSNLSPYLHYGQLAPQV